MFSSLRNAQCLARGFKKCCHSWFYTGDFGLYSWVPRGGDFTQYFCPGVQELHWLSHTLRECPHHAQGGGLNDWCIIVWTLFLTQFVILAASSTEWGKERDASCRSSDFLSAQIYKNFIFFFCCLRKHRFEMPYLILFDDLHKCKQASGFVFVNG